MISNGPDEALTLEALRRIRGNDLRPVLPDNDDDAPVEHTEGSRSRYNRGCRCRACTRAAVDYLNRRKSR